MPRLRHVNKPGNYECEFALDLVKSFNSQPFKPKTTSNGAFRMAIDYSWSTTEWIICLEIKSCVDSSGQMKIYCSPVDWVHYQTDSSQCTDSVGPTHMFTSLSWRGACLLFTELTIKLLVAFSSELLIQKQLGLRLCLAFFAGFYLRIFLALSSSNVWTRLSRFDGRFVAYQAATVFRSWIRQPPGTAAWNAMKQTSDSLISESDQTSV